MFFFLLGYFACVVLSSQVEYVNVKPGQDNQLFILDFYSIQKASQCASQFESRGIRQKIYIHIRILTINNSLPLTAISINQPMSNDLPAFQLLEKDEREVYYISRHFSYTTFDLKGLKPEVIYLMSTREIPVNIPTFNIDRGIFSHLQEQNFVKGVMELPHHPPLLDHPQRCIRKLKNYHHDKWPRDFVSFNTGYAMIRYSILNNTSIQHSAKAFRKYWPKSMLVCFIFPQNIKIRLVGTP